jgi:DNA-binding NtrC family response regulator
MARRRNLSCAFHAPEERPSNALGAGGALGSSRPPSPRNTPPADLASIIDELKSSQIALTLALKALSLMRNAAELQPLSRYDRIDFYEEVQRFQIKLIIDALILSCGSKKQAAELLGLKLSTLSMMINRYNLDSNENR